MHALPDHDPVTQITIVPRGQAGGMTISLPEEDRSYLSKRYMEDQIVALLGGRVAEKLCLGDISTGASNDIQRASRDCPEDGGLLRHERQDRHRLLRVRPRRGVHRPHHDPGPQLFRGGGRPDRRGGQGAWWSDAYDRCEEILEDNRDKLETVAQYLLEHETMDQEAFLAVFGEQPLSLKKEEV